MSSTLKNDLKRLESLAFHRLEYSSEDIRRYHVLRRAKNPNLPRIERLYQWMFVPISLWPFNIQNALASGLQALEKNQEIEENLCNLIELLPQIPKNDFCVAVTAHEHLVASGNYESLITAEEKFTSVQESVARSPEFRLAWKEFKSHWKPIRYANEKNLLRRSLSMERNLRVNFTLNWKNPRERFQAAFDAFCLQWNLYGMEGDMPLVNKLSVNYTPYGTMVFLPGYWSPDGKRDLRWSEIIKVHRLRSLKKQGKTLAEGKEWRREKAKNLHLLDQEAKKQNLTGDALHAFLCKGLGFVEGTDRKRLDRLRREFSATTLPTV